MSFKASWWFTMKNVVLPAALPMIFAGLRIAAGTALLLLVAAEMIAAEQGIGALILHYGDLMITERLMAGVIVLSLLGLVFSLTLEWLERRFVPWQRKNCRGLCCSRRGLSPERGAPGILFSVEKPG